MDPGTSAMTEAPSLRLAPICLLMALAACGNKATDGTPGSGGAGANAGGNPGNAGEAGGGGAGENTGGSGAGAGGAGLPSDGGAAVPGVPDAKPADPLNASACKLLQAGPFVPIAGATTFSLTAPEIKSDQQAYRVAIAKRNAAHVSFMVPAAGVYVIFTSTTAPLAVFALDGEMINVTNLRMSIPECPEVKGRHTLTLKMEGQILRLGPDPAAASVDVVIAPAGP
jgi:hypothetical protein